jgi:hypothetical protein
VAGKETKIEVVEQMKIIVKQLENLKRQWEEDQVLLGPRWAGAALDGARATAASRAPATRFCGCSSHPRRHLPAAGATTPLRQKGCSLDPWR